MSYLELLIIAASLSFDTFAVSLAGGAALADINFLRRGKIILSFAFFQTLFLFVGWLFGEGFIHLISTYDHWVASLILLFLGVRMLFEKSDGEKQVDLLNSRQLLLLSFATSVDALAVGISVAMISVGTLQIVVLFFFTALFSAIASLAGLLGGERFNRKFGNKASMAAGLVLIAIAIKILVSHLG